MAHIKRRDFNQFFRDLSEQPALGIGRDDYSVGPGTKRKKDSDGTDLGPLEPMTPMRPDGRGMDDQPFGEEWMKVYRENLRRLHSDPGWLFLMEVAGFTDQEVEAFVSLDNSLEQWQRRIDQALAQKLRIQQRVPSLEDITKQIEQGKQAILELEAQSDEVTDKFVFLSNMLFDFSKDVKLEKAITGVERAMKYVDRQDPKDYKLDKNKVNQLLEDMIVFTNETKTITKDIPTDEKTFNLFKTFVQLLAQIYYRLRSKDLKKNELLSKVKFILFFAKADKVTIDKLIADYGSPVPYPSFFFQGQIDFINLTSNDYFTLLQQWFYSKGIPDRKIGNSTVEKKVQDIFIKNSEGQWSINAKDNANFQLIKDDVFYKQYPYPFFFDKVSNDYSSVPLYLWDQWRLGFYRTYYEVTAELQRTMSNVAALETERVQVLTGVESLVPPEFPYVPSLTWKLDPLQSGMATLNPRFLSALHKVLDVFLEYCLKYWTDDRSYLTDERKKSELLDRLTTSVVVRTDFAKFTSDQLFKIGFIRPKRYNTKEQHEQAVSQYVETLNNLKGWYKLEEFTGNIVRRPHKLPSVKTYR